MIFMQTDSRSTPWRQKIRDSFLCAEKWKLVNGKRDFRSDPLKKVASLSSFVPPRISCPPPLRSAWPGPAASRGWPPCRPPCWTCSRGSCVSLKKATPKLKTQKGRSVVNEKRGNKKGFDNTNDAIRRHKKIRLRYTFVEVRVQIIT